MLSSCRETSHHSWLTVIGFGWDDSNEQKMLDCCGMGRRQLFCEFIDMKKQAEVLGYYDCSLASLAERLLGFRPPSSTQAINFSCRMILAHFLCKRDGCTRAANTA